MQHINIIQVILVDRKVFKWILTGASAAVILAAIYFTAGYFRPPDAGSTSEGDHDDIKVAAVGDSTTYGLLINNRSENAYPPRLDSLLGGGYWVGNFGANNYAAMKSADFPYDVTEEYQNSLDFNPDITVIMLGTNDSKSTNWNGREQFREEYSELVDTYAEHNPDTEIYLATPPKAFNEADRPGDINDENIDKITEIIKEVSAEKNAGLIDINQLTEDRRDWFQLDGVHPNADGAEGIAEEIHDHINE